MSRIEELLDLARQCYAQARGTLNAEARRTLEEMGDEYVRKTETVRRTSVQAVFPEPHSVGRKNLGLVGNDASTANVVPLRGHAKGKDGA